MTPPSNLTAAIFGPVMLAAGMAMAQTNKDQITDLSQVPQLHETIEQRDARMQWFRDAKFPAKPDPTPPAQQKPLLDAVTATPDQLARHLQDAIAWTRVNRDINPANAVLLYAWNENDEGGWLIPTLNPDGSTNRNRIKAVQDLRSTLKPLPTKN